MDVILAIEPELWPSFLPPIEDRLNIVNFGNKLVQIMPKARIPNGSVYYSIEVYERNGAQQLDAAIDLAKKGPNMTGFTFAIDDEQ